MEKYGQQFFRNYLYVLDEAAPPLAIPNIGAAGRSVTRAPQVAAVPPPIATANVGDLRGKYLALVTTLELTAPSDEGFFGRNFRRNRNYAKLAEFARENDLPGIYHPDGNWIKFDVDEEGFETDQVDSASSPNFDEMKEMAAIGVIPSSIRDRLNQEIADYSSGDRSWDRRGGVLSNILGTPDPDSAKELGSILKQNDAIVAQDQPAVAPELDPDISGEPAFGPGKPPPPSDEVTVEPLPPPPAEPLPAEPPTADDDAVAVGGSGDDPLTKPEKPAKSKKDNLNHLKDFVGLKKGGLRNDPEYKDAIKQLQKKLGIKADGIYGPNTRAAVRDFQTTHKLAVDGDAGPQTIGKMVELQKADQGEPLKKVEPPVKPEVGDLEPGHKDYQYKPGDYTGSDGIEDMSTGRIVKPDSTDTTPPVTLPIPNISTDTTPPVTLPIPNISGDGKEDIGNPPPGVSAEQWKDPAVRDIIKKHGVMPAPIPNIESREGLRHLQNKLSEIAERN
jgi:peptidoglycan hydrolase-like protein with peptidoglycan-binding domain